MFKSKPLSSRNLKSFEVFLLFIVTNWVAYFWHFSGFGLYEDDYNRIPQVMDLSWLELGNLVLKFLKFEGSQGRPLHPILIHVFSFLGEHLGGLSAMYLFGYLVILSNSFLFYLLLKRLYGSQFFAIIGTLTFCLFPADTTRDYLTHSLGVQPSLTLLLLALHFYTAEREKISYLFIFATLFTYETVFPIFLVAPLIQKKWDSRLAGELYRHVLVMVMMIFCGIILRKFTGESVSSLSVLNGLLLFGNPILGSLTSISLLGYRPLETLLKLDRELLIILPFCFVGFASILLRSRTAYADEHFENFTLTSKLENKIFQLLRLPQFCRDFAKPLILGLLMLILAYPLTLTTLGITINGRGTRVHTAAGIGISILFACICCAFFNTITRHKKRWATYGLAGFFSLLVGFGLTVQKDYQASWQYQRAFWTDLVALCPDLEEGTVIFVESTSMPDTRQRLPFQQSRGVSQTRQIKANEWNLPLILEQIYQFSDDWVIPPKVYRLQLDWQDKILSDDGLFQVSAAIPWIKDPERQVEASNVIFLETDNQELTRRTEPLFIAGQKFALKSNFASEVSSFEKTRLYDYLIQEKQEDSVKYLFEKSTTKGGQSLEQEFYAGRTK